MAELLIIPAVLFGLIASLMELFFVHSDEGAGVHWLGHGLHAIPFCVIGAIVAMNVHWALGFLPESIGGNALLVHGLPILIGLFIAFKVKAAAAIIQGHGNVGEKLPHALAVGAVIAASPYIWGLIAPIMPAFLKAF
ncbi:hypothetical protein JXM83_02985 [Candidatus Woesearchaeota archaeon]|nr:hypothetical protein [Candidatus Woesearchaeota archaeon]